MEKPGTYSKRSERASGSPSAGQDPRTRSAVLNQRLREYIGKGGQRFVPARDRITLEAVRRMTDSTGDRNPVYADFEAAARSVHGALVAPPGCLLAWWTQSFEPVGSSDWVDDQGIRRFRLDPMPARLKGERGGGSTLEDVHGALAEAGYESLVIAGGEMSLARYPRVGDRLFFSDAKVESVLGPMRTGMGTGFFVTHCITVKDQEDMPVAGIRIVFLNFMPSSSAAPQEETSSGSVRGDTAANVRQPAGPSRPATMENVSVGQELPPMIVEVTPSLVLAGALYTNDALDVHHDGNIARRRGFKDIFMNNTTTLAWYPGSSGTGRDRKG